MVRSIARRKESKLTIIDLENPSNLDLAINVGTNDGFNFLGDVKGGVEGFEICPDFIMLDEKCGEVKYGGLEA
ncbi:hypothetical protein VNO78_06643 [Psophocarpus tetragonolobus]|uniref:Uncharacterized protein n=1 Tax=Psophocarpus tetragonolobus TaxID=3891 RepID=A0AAN9SSQ5_PSOTE